MKSGGGEVKRAAVNKSCKCGFPRVSLSWEDANNEPGTNETQKIDGKWIYAYREALAKQTQNHAPHVGVETKQAKGDWANSGLNSACELGGVVFFAPPVDKHATHDENLSHEFSSYLVRKA